MLAGTGKNNSVQRFLFCEKQKVMEDLLAAVEPLEGDAHFRRSVTLLPTKQRGFFSSFRHADTKPGIVKIFLYLPNLNFR